MLHHRKVFSHKDLLEATMVLYMMTRRDAGNREKEEEE